MAGSDQLLKRLGAFLEARAGLARRAAAQPFTLKNRAREFRLRADDRRFVERFADGQLDLELDGLVVDGELGTLGLVHVVAPGTPDQVQIAAREFVEQAAYLRHLADMRRLALPQAERLLPYAVEVVFLTETNDLERVAALGRALRDSQRYTALPHAINVGVADIPDALSDADAERRLRQAFCWLLVGARRWSDSLRDLDAQRAGAAPRRWDELRLENFRRPGLRRWTKHADARLHLLFGPNGSGKSTLAEAFEFAVTGWSGRLGPAPAAGEKYGDRLSPLVWRGRDGNAATHAAASVAAKPEPNAPPTPAPTAAPELTRRTDRDAAFAPATLPADAFRLDQTLADRLVAQDGEKRARTWLEAFFADIDRELRARRDGERAFAAAVAGLGFTAKTPTTTAPPPSGKAPDPLQGFLEAARGTGTAPLTFGRLLETIPGAPAVAQFQSLSGLGLAVPELLGREVKFADGDVVGRGEWFKRLDEALAADRELLRKWEATKGPELDALLDRLGNDAYDTAAAQAEPDRRAAFGRWLHWTAATDLLERAIAIAETRERLGAAQPAGPAASFDPRDLAAPVALGELRNRHHRACAERDAMREAWTRPVTGTTGAGAPGTAATSVVRVHELAPLAQAARDGVFSTLLTAEDVPAVEAAVRDRRKTPVRSLVVGSGHWTSPLRSEASRRRAAVETLGDLVRQPQADTTLADRLLGAFAAAHRLGRLETRAAERFRREVEDGPLGDALAELLALFTPARWGYTQLQTRVDVSGRDAAGGGKLEFSTLGHDAAKILNTAELNTLALALHLLCAPRVDNPYRVLFLDDPLQNMDELTVTTIARGLARLMRLWERDDRLKEWNVVLLLHGEANCERVARECRTARYQFPWLAPVVAKTQSPVAGAVTPPGPQPEDVAPLLGSEQAELQPMEGFVEIPS